MLWLTRSSWMAVAVLGGDAIAAALQPHSHLVRVVATVTAWVLWGVVAVALLVPSTIALTVCRSLVPLSAVAAVLTIGGAASPLSSTVAVACSVVMCALTASGELGQAMVQASAYGDEQRFLLRPPVAFLAPAIVTWALTAASIIAGPLLIAARSMAAGGVVSLVAISGTWVLAPRLHRLARRWVVLVPAGVVVHDHVVLADTVMIAARNMRGMSLAFADTEAADLTGPAPGHAVELSFGDAETVVFAGTRTNPAGRAIHATAVLVAPTRPGRLIAAAGARGLTVGARISGAT